MQLLMIILLLTSLAGKAVSQDRDGSRSAQGMRAQPFFFDALNFAEYESYGLQGRLDVFVHVPYDIITFVKKDEFYVGGYEITALVRHSDGNQVNQEELWDRTVRLLSFERTNHPGYYDLSQKSLQLSPGNYLVEIIFEDKESLKEFRLSKQITIRKFDANLLGVSDLMLVRDVEQEGGRKKISPQINPNVAALKDGFDVFYEVYNPFDLGNVTIDYTILTKGKVLSEERSTQSVRQGRNTFLASIPSSGLGIGTYTLKVELRHPGDTTKSALLATIERPFIVEWLTAGSPVSIADLDEAIEQLRYFAKSEELDYIRDAEDEEERRRRFEEFWERHNPISGSRSNPALIEYYNRVAYANQHYGHYIDGWKTDRGMVYILYGPPDYVERHPLDVESKPYEVWEYYDINRRYVFVDESGFGDYRLMYPVWDERNRMR